MSNPLMASISVGHLMAFADFIDYAVNNRIEHGILSKDGEHAKASAAARAAIAAAEADKDVWTVAVVDANKGVERLVWVRGEGIEDATRNLYAGIWPGGIEPPTHEFYFKGRIQTEVGPLDEVDLTAPKAPETPLDGLTKILVSAGPKGS